MAYLQLLPWWDWRPLHQQRCLISNPHFVAPPTFSSDDCVACEAIDHVDRLVDNTYQHLLDAYLQRNAPVVIVDAMDDWPAMRFNFNIENITQVIGNKFSFNASLVFYIFFFYFFFIKMLFLSCSATCLRKRWRKPDLARWPQTYELDQTLTLSLFSPKRRISIFLNGFCIGRLKFCCSALFLDWRVHITIIFYLVYFLNSKFFVHRLNCDSTAMKALRKFYYRPYFLAPSVAPAHYNWVLMSSNYKAKLFKHVR